MNLTKSSTGDEIIPLALTIHELVNRLPITMRTKNKRGVRIEGGKVVDNNYSGPLLEKVIENGKILNETPDYGPYKGVPVIVVPIFENKELIASIGVVDTTKGIYSDIIEITKRPEQFDKYNSMGEFY